MRVTRKLLVPTLIFIAVIIAGLIAYNTVITVQQFEQNEAQRLENMNEVFQTRLNSLGNVATALASETANNPEIQAAFAAKDRERLTELTLASYQAVDALLGVPQHQFHVAPATSFLRLHKLEKFDDDLSSFRFTVLAANAEQRAVNGLEIGRAGLGVRGVVPVNYQGEHIGTVEFGSNVDLTLLNSLKKGFGYDWQLLLSRAPAEVAVFEGATGDTQGPTSELLLQASTLENPLYAPLSSYEQALAGTTNIEHTNIAEVDYAILSAPIYDFSGNVIGVLNIISDHTAIIQQQNRQMLLSLGILLATLLIVSFGFSALAGRTLRPIGTLAITAEAIAGGDFSQRAKIESDDEIGGLAQVFNTMTEQLQGLFGTMEVRVANATRDLTLAAEVGRSVSQAQDVETLLKDAVNLIQDRFNMYYTQAYLLDSTERQLVLHAGTGAVGQQLLNRHHILPMDLASLNGTAAVERRAVIVEDTESSTIHRPNPLLPETRSEMVVPLLVGDRVLGVLDMQSRKAGALNQENLAAFEALAGQIAIAIQNATLLAETEAIRQEVEARARRLTRTGWEDFLDAVERSERIGYSYDMENITELNAPISENVDEHTLVTEISVSDETIGLFHFDGQETWTQDEATLANDVADLLGQQVENLRLLSQADQYRAEAESAVRRLTREGWESHLALQPEEKQGFSYDLNTIIPFTDDAIQPESTTYPLDILGEKIGEINISGTDAPNDEVTELLTAVSEHLSARVENLRLFEETERGQLELDKRARELATVAEVSTAASNTLDVDKLLQEVVDLTRERFDLYHAHIFLLDEKNENLQVKACGWEAGSLHVGTHGETIIPLSREDSLVAQAAHTKEAIIVNDVRSDPNWLPNEQLPNTASELATPLIVGDKVLGVLDIQSDQIGYFTDEDVNIQTTLAAQVAVALQNARSYAQTQQQAEHETLINVINQRIQNTTSIEDALQVTIRELGRALGAKRTSVQLEVKSKKQG